MAEDKPRQNKDCFNKETFQRVANLDLLRRPQPPKFEARKGYDRIPKVVQEKMSRCVICKHHFTPRPERQANPLICGRYWCIVVYQQKYGKEGQI